MVLSLFWLKNFLGLSFFSSAEILQLIEEAIKYFEEAAKYNNKFAEYTLGKLHI
jgi:hypothetical protein